MGSSQQHVYAKCLPVHYGYPLWNPEPNHTLPCDYQQDGFQIGDVGIVDPDRGFDVLFNICKPYSHPLHKRHGVPSSHRLTPLSDEDVFVESNAISAGSVIFSSTVERTSLDTEHEFTARSSEGAILILPHGAAFHDLQPRAQFRDIAIQSATDWYSFATEKRLRRISKDSLYLITGFYKARSWSLALFQNAPPGGGGSLKAIKVGSGSDFSTNYQWKHTFPAVWKYGPRRSCGNANQSIFLRGYKIVLSEHSFWKQPSVEVIPLHEFARDVEPSSFSLLKRRFNKEKKIVRDSSDAVHQPVLSQPFHYSDVINSHLSRPDDLAREGFSKIRLSEINSKNGSVTLRDRRSRSSGSGDGASDNLEVSKSCAPKPSNNASRRNSTPQRELETTRHQADSCLQLDKHNSMALGSPNTSAASVAVTKRKYTPGIEAFKQWMRKTSIVTDTLFSHEATVSPYENVLAYNALLHVRSKNWCSAYQDARMSVDIRPSTMGFICQALAQIGNSEPEKAIQVFDLTFWNCDPDESNLLLLIKSIIFFVAGKYDEAISRVHDLIRIAVSSDVEMMYCCHQVLANMYFMGNDFEHALHSLECAQEYVSSNTGCHLDSISLAFSWSFETLEITVRQRHCESLYTAGHIEEAAEAFRNVIKNLDGDIPASEEIAKWVTDFRGECVSKLEVLGDEALSSEDHEKALERYTSALSLDPSDPIDILLKRSKVLASQRLWEFALRDADEVIKLDPSSHQGYERKYIALYGAEDYDGAVVALQSMLSIIQQSPDKEVRRKYATTSLETICAAIDAAIHEIFTLCPLVLIDVTTGRLCDAQQRIQMFKSDPAFKKLICEAAVTKIDSLRIRQSAMAYFKWVMFSHTWDGREPTFLDVNLVDTVWNLDESPLNEKLRRFCSTASTDGFRWAWSDTCCIDKTTSTILSRSLTSMYTWYERAAATLVYLVDVLSSSEPGALTKSRWMTRAWTLQELLASKVIRFYNCDWKPYLNDTCTNHKESQVIMQELAQAMKVPHETISAFRPDDVTVREKLRLASTRRATEIEDAAYSLIGIFSSDIIPQYGIGNNAIGLLLGGIVDRSGDVTVIAWTGISSPYNSALPSSLVVYSRMPYCPPPAGSGELDMQVEQLRAHFPFEDAKKTYNQVVALGRTTFSNRCLRLPCLAFSVSKIRVLDTDGNDQRHHYVAMAPLLGDVQFRTMDMMPLKMQRRLIFVHAWRHDLFDPSDWLLTDDPDPEVASVVEIKGVDEAEPASPIQAEHPPPMDCYTRALRLIARLGHPFNALLLEQQRDGRYKRVATDEEIISPGIAHPITPKKLRSVQVRVLEIV